MITFTNFIEEYKSSLTEAVELKQIIDVSKSDYRVRKILVPYVMKDKETYKNLIKLSKQDEYARELVCDCILFLDKIKNTGLYIKNNEIKDLILNFNEIVNDKSLLKAGYELSSINFNNYCKVINSYLLKLKISQDSNLKSILDKKYSEIDFDDLIKL